MVDLYVITTGNAERISRIKRILSGIEFEFVYSEKIEDLFDLELKYKKESHRFRQKAIMAGEIGAFKTHAKAWEKIIESNKKSIIIEDNIDFIKEPSDLINEEVSCWIDSCGLISFTDFPYKYYPNRPFVISLVPEKKPLPIVCYGVTPARALNLLNAMKKNPYVMPIDKWLSIPKLCGCYSYISHVSFARRKPELSSIANSKKGKKTFNPVNVIFWAINKKKYNY